MTPRLRLAAAAAQAVAAPLVPAVAPAAVSAGAASDVARKRTRDDAGSTDDDDDDEEEDDDDASELDDASVVDFADVNADRAEGTYFAEEILTPVSCLQAALCLCRSGQAQVTACEAETGNSCSCLTLEIDAR